MAKTESPPEPPLLPPPDEEEAKPTRTRKVIADRKLGLANDILRTLSELDTSERKIVMQIVNMLVDNPSPSTEESE
jgi:hypothetical protein